jgi:DNA-binding CsgD family transcriptional regulator
MNFNHKLEQLKKVADSLPGVVIVHNVETLSVEFMSSRGLKELGLTMPELAELGADYNKLYFNEQDAADYIPKVIALMERGHEDEVVTFFQQVRFSVEGEWLWHLSSTGIFHKVGAKTTHIITIACPVDKEHHIVSKITHLLDEKNFLVKHQKAYDSLTKQEKKIIRHMAIGKSSHEIAEELNISVATVNTHRKNIRAKLEAKTMFDITKFAQAFNLI